MNNQDLMARFQAAMVMNYGKMPAVIVRGKGSQLWDADGKEYIDLFAGFGGTILGHCHPALVDAVTMQAQALWAVGNQFYSEPQIRVAEHLKSKGFDGRAFFCHSGAESNEAAIKLARLAGGEGRFKIISMHKGFHGRTLGALSATPTVEYQKDFLPMTPGFAHVPFNDVKALEAAIDAQTCGVIVEPIQGEGGLNVPEEGYLKGVREICDRHKLTLIFDEVWTGCGRTGKYFAHQHFGVTPDIMTLGKAIGGGVPVGCMFATPEKAALLKPGMHGCTLGGNPLCAAVAAAVFDVLDKDQLPAKATKLGEMAKTRIRGFKNAGSRIKDVRGHGLFIGVELTATDGTPVVMAALAKGLIVNATSKNVLRICPALTIEEQQLMRGLDILEQAIAA
ncbi:MAG: aspartate aminotransferase family protein [Phycisphaerales bacterium]|nr:aspartate aminotransferase family protein [Phycisphaerales bacterium]